MKRLLALGLALIMVFTFVACGGGGTTTTTTAAPTTAPPATEATTTTAAPVTEAPTAAEPVKDTGGPIKVDVFWYTFADTYLTSVRNAMEDTLKGFPNLAATQHDCENSQAIQTQKIETAITAGSDLLIVNIVTTGSDEAAQAVCDLAKGADIPIIFFNREISDGVVNSYDKACFVGTDADEAGYMEGQAIADFLLDGENLSRYDLNGDGNISYIMFRGEHGNPEAYGRTKYSVTEANRLLAGKAKLVPSPANTTDTQYEDDGISNFFLYGNWSAENAANLMRTALASYSLTDGSIELIIANNDDQALGAIEAMNEEGFNTGSGGYIPVFGVDATSVAVEAINAGKMTGTVLQDGPAMAKQIVELADNVANGRAVFAGTESKNVDAGVNKIRIPYAIVAGSAPAYVAPPPVSQIKADIFWYTFADTYLTSVRNAMEDALKGYPDIIATQHDCENSQAIQTQKIETAIAAGSDLLIVNIVTTGSDEAAQAVCDLAKGAGIPIIFFNREISNDVVNSYNKACFVGTDADEAGYMEGQAIAEFLLTGDNLSKYDLNGDGNISYIMFRGEHGNPEAFGRTKYSVTEANNLLAGKAKLVPSPANTTDTQYEDDGISNYFLYGNWSAENAANLMRTALASYSLTDGSIELIIANNDDQALGAIEAMNEEGFNTGSGGYIPVFGVDATSVAVEAINAGKMTGTVLQDGPAMARCIVGLAGNVLNGEDVFANTNQYNIDSGVQKIRIAYAIVS